MTQEMFYNVVTFPTDFVFSTPFEAASALPE
jgi:hypothetical protein